jgi:hypothetical protein
MTIPQFGGIRQSLANALGLSEALDPRIPALNRRLLRNPEDPSDLGRQTD